MTIKKVLRMTIKKSKLKIQNFWILCLVLQYCFGFCAWYFNIVLDFVLGALDFIIPVVQQ